MTVWCLVICAGLIDHFLVHLKLDGRLKLMLILQLANLVHLKCWPCSFLVFCKLQLHYGSWDALDCWQRFGDLYSLYLSVVVPWVGWAGTHLLWGRHLARNVCLQNLLIMIDSPIKLTLLRLNLFLHEFPKLGYRDVLVVTLAKTLTFTILRHQPGKNLFVSIKFTLLVRHIVAVTRLLV